MGGIRKSKAEMKLNMAKDVKNRKRFYRYMSQKRKAKDSVPPLINKKGES